MRNVDIANTRNFALIGHSGDGKTSLGDSILHRAGIIPEAGDVAAGSSTLNHLPEERDGHTHSVSSHLFAFDWNENHITLVDTPGDPNFQGDGQIAIQALDGAVLVVSAVDGLKSGSERMFEAADAAHVPVVAFINGLDKDQADFNRAVETLADLDRRPAVASIPIGGDGEFAGVVDLVHMKAFGSEGEAPIPEELAEEVALQREVLCEVVAECDDALLETYLEKGELSEAELVRGLALGTRKGEILPVLCGSATEAVGVDMMLQDLVELLPSPQERGEWHGTSMTGEDAAEQVVKPDPDGPFSGLVFKTIIDRYAGSLSILRVVSGTITPDSQLVNATTGNKVRVGKLFLLQADQHVEVPEAGPGDVIALPKLKDVHTGNVLTCEKGGVHLDELTIPRGVISYAIQARNSKEEEKVYEALSRLVEEDPSLQLARQEATGEFLLTGMGELHLRTTVGRLHRLFNLDIELKRPQVPYRETITKKVTGIEGKLKKQTGGAGMYGVCYIDLEPSEPGAGFEFVDRVVGGAIPRNLIPAVEKGIVDACTKGPLGGFPLVDVRATLVDGKYHSVDSNEMAFKLAGSFALRAAAEAAKPVLLEPYMHVEINVPDAHVGDVMGDLSGRRGVVESTEAKGHHSLITARVPMAEMLEYATTLTSLSGGTGSFTMEFSHYAPAPARVQQDVVDSASTGETEH